MIKRRLASIILSLASILILTACAQRLSYPDQSGVSEQSLSSGPNIRSISKDEFLYTVGWLDDTTILLAMGSNGIYGLYSHDLDTGKERPIRTFSDRLVFVALSTNGRRILVQVASQQGNNVMMIDKSGNVLADIRFSEGLLTGVSWNPANEGKLFLSSKKTVGSLVNYLWDLSSEEALVALSVTEEMPDWYSENMYLQKKTTNEGVSVLLLSDIRFPGKDTVIDQEILAYGLEGESVWVVAPSDINAEELFVVSYYPLLVAQGYVALPCITDGSRLVIPEFRKGRDSDETFALLPKQESDGAAGISFELAKIDFSENAMEVLTEVERMAPISVSPEGTYVLYGEHYEYLYDVEGNGWIHLSE